jgi:hypothetical protein
MMCAICRRDARGFVFAGPRHNRHLAPPVKLCSHPCQQIAARLKGMIDPNKHETNALAVACQTGGEYVESLAKTDLSDFTQVEWATLIDVVVTAFQESLRTAYADDPPF